MCKIQRPSAAYFRAAKRPSVTGCDAPSVAFAMIRGNASSTAMNVEAEESQSNDHFLDMDNGQTAVSSA